MAIQLPEEGITVVVHYTEIVDRTLQYIDILIVYNTPCHSTTLVNQTNTSIQGGGNYNLVATELCKYEIGLCDGSERLTCN